MFNYIPPKKKVKLKRLNIMIKYYNFTYFISNVKVTVVGMKLQVNH